MNQPEFELTLPAGSSLRVIDCSSENLLGRNTLFVASSRLPQKLDDIPQLFDGLLKFAMQLDPATDALITAKGTACDLFVRRIAELFQIPLVSVALAKSKKEFEKAELQNDGNCAVVLDVDARGIDFALTNLASGVVIFSIRKNGNLHSAVKSRLENGQPTKVLVDPDLTTTALSNELLDLGASGWYLLRDQPDRAVPDCQVVDVQHFDDVDSSKYLLHWTRRRIGPWPDQSSAEFIDDLLFCSSRKDHRSFASLRRILATGRVYSSNELTRDPRPVVCFSDISFDEMLKRRVFRPHLSRWDFEPYGIAIRKDWLKAQGARPVIYGDGKVWESLGECDRPFFQLNDRNGKVDWSVENEWRAVGDVNLCQVPVDAAMVFVPSLEEAREIAPFSRWPIVVLSKK